MCSLLLVYIVKVLLLINSVHVKILMALNRKDCSYLLLEVASRKVFLPWDFSGPVTAHPGNPCVINWGKQGSTRCMSLALPWYTVKICKFKLKNFNHTTVFSSKRHVAQKIWKLMLVVLKWHWWLEGNVWGETMPQCLKSALPHILLASPHLGDPSYSHLVTEQHLPLSQQIWRNQ